MKFKGKVRESLLRWVYSGKPPGLAGVDGMDLTAVERSPPEAAQEDRSLSDTEDTICVFCYLLNLP